MFSFTGRSRIRIRNRTTSRSRARIFTCDNDGDKIRFFHVDYFQFGVLFQEAVPSLTNIRAHLLKNDNYDGTRLDTSEKVYEISIDTFRARWRSPTKKGRFFATGVIVYNYDIETIFLWRELFVVDAYRGGACFVVGIQRRRTHVLATRCFQLERN